MTRYRRRTTAAIATVAGAVLLQAAPAGAVATGAQSFTIESNGQTGAVWAVGRVAGAGRVKTISDTDDLLLFKGGSLELSHTTTVNHDSFDATACTVSIDESGTYRLTGVSGAYAGATGSGTFHAHGMAWARPTAQGCSGNGHAFITVDAHGSTALP